ncbi:unnamed protein product, partial [Rotaria socialis]
KEYYFRYPPLPDLFLDNIPHISWAFAVSEYIAIAMSFIFLLILIFHKYWYIILRRFFALSGTIFFLRSITMLVTSLSVIRTNERKDFISWDNFLSQTVLIESQLTG